jgi:Dolichyl-phosphate-mannose-protein mannosyltransferase
MTQVQLTTFKNGWVRSSADWLETRPLTTLVIVAVAYFAVTSYLARLKPLWSDEFYTLYIAKAGFKGAWEILLTGADQHPPTFYWLTNICLQLFGFGPAILRLPELIAFWIMLLCLFVVIARKTSNLIAYFAMLLPCLTPIYAYAFEARGYGLLLGAAAASYFFWEEASSERYRRISVPLFALFCAAAVCSHYYGILIMIPFAIGEIIRCFKRKKADVMLWLAFFAPLVPLFLFLPVILGARGYSVHFWAAPAIHNITESFDLTLGLNVLVLLSIVVITVICFYIPGQFKSLAFGFAGPNDDVELYQLAVVIGFVALPVIVYLLAYFVTNAFYPRYAIACAIGVVIAFALFINVICSNLKVCQLALFGLAIFGVAHNMMALRIIQIYTNLSIADSVAAIERLKTGLPVLITNLHTFQMLEFYGPANVRAKIFYAIDPSASLKYLGHDTIERGVIDMRPFSEGNAVFGGNAVSYQQFTSQNSRFYVYGPIDNWNWICSKLIDDGFQVILIERRGDRLMFEVTKGHLEK